MDKLVSIIIPCYNSEKYILQALTSCIEQTYQNLEIIVIDDGSTDESKTIVEELQYSDKRIKVNSQDNLGSCSARNTGLMMSTGYYVMFLDADDYLSPLTIQACIKELVKHDVVSFNAFKVDNEGNILERRDFRPRFKNLAISWMEHAPWNGCVIFKRVLALHNWNSQYDAIDEFDYYVRMALSNPSHTHIKTEYFYYRDHSSADRKSNQELPYKEQLTLAFQSYLISNEFNTLVNQNTYAKAYYNFIIDQFDLPIKKKRITPFAYFFFLLKMKKKHIFKKNIINLLKSALKHHKT